MRTLLVALAAVASARLNEPTPARRLTDELDMAYLSEVAANGQLGAKVLFKLDAKHKLVEKNKAHKIAANVVDALVCPGAEPAERVFRDAGKHEAEHEKFGLHLWYSVACGAADDDGLDAGAFTEELTEEPATCSFFGDKKKCKKGGCEWKKGACTAKKAESCKPHLLKKHMLDSWMAFHFTTLCKQAVTCMS